MTSSSYVTLDFGPDCSNPYGNYSQHMHPPVPIRTKRFMNQRTMSATPTTVSVPTENDRRFATALCIFASVLTSVLVMMFYLVGEAAFRIIILIISFVFVLTLLLACFLRQPSLMLLGQTSPFLLTVPPLLSRTNEYQFSVPVLEMCDNSQTSNDVPPSYPCSRNICKY